jgi:hypothetical protein
VPEVASRVSDSGGGLIQTGGEVDRLALPY